MSEHHHNEPHVSGHELRAALATDGPRRRNPLMEAAPAWEWTTDEQAELEELRASAETLEARVQELEGMAADARNRERDLHEALHRLAAARPWQRRGVTRELAVRGLL